MNDTLLLTATTTPAGRAVSWSSGDTNIATVSSSGLVTFNRAGTVTVTASATGLTSQSVTLYGIVKDGVYNLVNAGSHMYVQMNGSYLFQSSAITQAGGSGSSTNTTIMWRFHYIENGKYTIRSYANPTLALGDNAATLPEKATTYYTSVTNEAGTLNVQWYISNDSAGYILTNAASGRVLAMPAGDESTGTQLIFENSAGTASDANCRWFRGSISSVPTGIYLYTYNETSFQTTGFTSTSLTLNIGEYCCIKAIYRNPNDISQLFDYGTSDGSTNVIILNGGGGITACSAGTRTVQVTHRSSGTSKRYNVKVNKNAIIILPGIMGSILVAGDNNSSYSKGTVLWDMSLVTDMKNGNISKTDVIARLYSLQCLANGESKNDVDVYQNNYGTGDIYKELYESLYTAYGSKYEICFFAYDWRLSNYTSGIKLDEYITANSYDNVKLVAHSMGGLVASAYLSLGNAQREKVETLITLGSPLLGAPTVPYVWGSENLDYGDFLTESGVPNWILTIFNIITTFCDPIDSIFGNFESMYEMFPTEKYFSSGYANDSYLISSMYLLTVEQITKLITPITTYTGTKNILKLLPKYNTVLADRAESFHESLYIDNEHITHFVNCYYIASYNVQTIEKVECCLPANTYSVYHHTDDGDGTVPLSSAVLGDRYSSRSFYVEGVKHVALAKDSQVLQFVNNLLSGNLRCDDFEPISTDISR